ncbi:hypothetical protein [Bacillus sp. FJAT-18017]|uniref:hypothetical protein n=1 Tax=Bacillus sp. FJAT-18017 TaxID=1705566 RepID=UPI000AD45952|nr:hypothetical protein [Bacillus sp. FJAT-18017]
MKKGRSKAIRYWRNSLYETKLGLWELSPAMKLILTAVLSLIAAIFQSAGGYMPGIGFFVSAMATLPLFLATVVSVRQGFLSYLVTILLLLVIQPSELLIFTFTTGLLGWAIGFCFRKLKIRFLVVSLAGATLFMGIFTLLFIFHFPVLGPGVGTSFQFGPLLLVAIFSFLYAWMAAEACSFVLKRLLCALPEKVIKSVSTDGSVSRKHVEK